MNTKDLDVVYFVKDGIRNEELRFSIRSVCMNMPYKRIWIFGGCPQNIVPDVRVRVEQEGNTKWDKVRTMYRMAAENKEITDDFILFNDDFFVMKPTDTIEPIYRCTLDEHIPMLENNFGNKPTPYSRLLRSCNEELKRSGKTQYSYELHTPFIFNKQKLLKILNEYPDQHCTRTFYGNFWNIGGEKTSDIKVFSDKPKFDFKSTRFLSTDDSVININNSVWRYIKKTLNKKSKYEI